MASPSADDIARVQDITIHISLAPEKLISASNELSQEHLSFIEQCKRLQPNGHLSLHIHRANTTFEDVVGWFQTIFVTGTAAAAFLGASLLSIATGDLGDDHAGIRAVAATGATLFILLFILCSGFALLFGFAGSEISRLASGKGRWSRHGAMRGFLSTMSLILQVLPVAGACCLFWVLKDFVDGAGLAGFIITLVLGVVATGIWFWHTFFGRSP